MDLGLEGKVALVTAASRGLGYAIALELAAERATIVLSARDEERLASATRSIREMTGVDAVAIRADCTVAEDVCHLVTETEHRFGQIDILINNAPGPTEAPFITLSDAAWREAIDTKLLAMLRCAREVLPGMMRRRFGRIVNIVGTHGRQPHAYAVAAGVVNAALLNLTKALAELGAPANVLVNAINPGPIETDRLTYLAERKAEELGRTVAQAKQVFAEEILLRRFGSPREVAAAVAFLVSERASFITGTILDIDGGQTRCL